MSTTMKLDPTERTNFWRGLIRNCATPEAAIALLRQGGLSEGRAIAFLAKHNGKLYNAFRASPPQATRSRDLASRFNIIGA